MVEYVCQFKLVPEPYLDENGDPLPDPPKMVTYPDFPARFAHGKGWSVVGDHRGGWVVRFAEDLTDVEKSEMDLRGNRENGGATDFVLRDPRVSDGVETGLGIRGDRLG